MQSNNGTRNRRNFKPTLFQNLPRPVLYRALAFGRLKKQLHEPSLSVGPLQEPLHDNGFETDKISNKTESKSTTKSHKIQNMHPGAPSSPRSVINLESEGENYFNTVVSLRQARASARRQGQLERALRQDIYDVSINMSFTMEAAMDVMQGQSEIMQDYSTELNSLRRQITSFRETLRRLQGPTGRGTIGDPIDVDRSTVEVIDLSGPELDFLDDTDMPEGDGAAPAA